MLDPLYKAEEGSIKFVMTDSSKKQSDGQETIKTTGGIDLNTDQLDMMIRGNAGDFDMDLTPEKIQMLQTNVTGFEPIIIGVKPLESVPMFLGMKNEERVAS